MLTDLEKAYIAGFLDGDGCVMFQLVRRKDYVYGYQVRASVVFYQKKNHRDHLEWIRSKFQHGYLRDRSDGMSEYTIVGIRQVEQVLMALEPYLRLKRPHAQLAFKIIKALPKRFTPNLLLQIGELVDQFKDLNYSKRRTNTTEALETFFIDQYQSRFPVTTDS